MPKHLINLKLSIIINYYNLTSMLSTSQQTSNTYFWRHLFKEERAMYRRLCQKVENETERQKLKNGLRAQLQSVEGTLTASLEQLLL